MARSAVRAITLSLVLHASSSDALARVLVEHRGATDPAAEGWSGAGGEAALDEGGPGLDAWVSDDDSTTDPSGAFYERSVTPEEVAEASAVGWKLSARLRIVEFSDEPFGSVIVAFADGTTRYAMHFGTTETGDPIVRLPTTSTSASAGPTVRLRGAGAGYHLYQLVFDPIEGNADLFVDGDAAIIDHTGFGDSEGRIFWGSDSDPDTGHGNYNFVRFEILDAPLELDPQININLAGSGSNPMVSAEIAGAPEARDDNWNNLSGDEASGGPIAVADGDGSPVPDTMVSYAGFGPASLSDGGGINDNHFFSSLIDARNYPAFDLDVTDVPYDVYDVYAYHQGGAPTNQSRVARFSLGELTFYAKRPVALNQYIRSEDTEDRGSMTSEGSYVVFERVSGPDFTLRFGGASSLDGFRRARVSGFQIVRVAQVPEPTAAIAPLLAGLWLLTRRARPRMDGNS